MTSARCARNASPSSCVHGMADAIISRTDGNGSSACTLGSQERRSAVNGRCELRAGEVVMLVGPARGVGNLRWKRRRGQHLRQKRVGIQRDR